MTHATVYRGSSDGKVIQGKEIFDAGGETVLLKVLSSRQRTDIARLHILAYAAQIFITFPVAKS
jgi:hypothetical protein